MLEKNKAFNKRRWFIGKKRVILYSGGSKEQKKTRCQLKQASIKIVTDFSSKIKI